ncbi:MAG: hypothetical protein GKR90_15605 [Pseudomonadales bacterium]|nr:hypothetical protein [Pseudomonadales bacterium]
MIFTKRTPESFKTTGFSPSIQMVLATALLVLFSPSAMSDGTCSSVGGVSNQGFGFANVSFDNSRAAFHARGKNGKRIKYCVLVDGEPKRISRPRLRAYKRAYVEDFLGALVDCDNPTQLALARVKPRKLPLVLTYLSQNYRLRLAQRSPEERIARHQQNMGIDPTVAAAN